MSLPYPHDRARSRQDDGEQPYKDARESLGEKDAKLRSAEQPRDELETDEEKTARLEDEAEERLSAITADVADRRHERTNAS